MKRKKLILPALTLLCAALAGLTNNATADELPGLAVQPASYFYTGKPYDEDLASYVFLYREYNPELTRWATPDPSGFPDGANGWTYVNNRAVNGVDPLGLKVQWVTKENSFSPNPTMEQKPATTFAWLISDPQGETVLLGNFTGTFSEVYNNHASVGFVTWRDQPSTSFGDIFSLRLWSRTKEDANWRPNGWTVYASFLENASYTDAQRKKVNQRINPIGAETTRDTLRGFSSYLYDYLLGQGAGFGGDLFYE